MVMYTKFRDQPFCVHMSARATHKDLAAWRESMRLVNLVYRETATFPKEEMFGLTAQIRRSAVSVPSNIAEGAGRTSSAELAQFVAIACGSLAELDTQLRIAVELGYLQANSKALQHADYVGICVRRLRKALAARCQAR